MAMKKVMLFFLFMVNLLSCADPQTDLFSVHVPDGFISARLGSSVLLPCTVSPSVDCKSYEVRWYRPDKYNNPVLLYKDLRVQENTGDVQYRNRVSLVGELEKGNVSLQLENLRVEDRGEYVCLVESIQWYDEASMSLNISVIGSHPLLSLADAGDQVNVTCVSDGWSTKAKLTWRDRKGKELNSAEHYKTDSEGLVSVSSWVLFSPSGSDWISCSVGLSEQEMKEIRVVPLKPGFWREAFISSLTLSLTVIITLVVLLVLVKQDLLPRCSSRKNAKIAGKLITYALPVDTEKTTERTLVSGFWREAFISSLTLSLIVIITLVVLLVLVRQDLLPHCSSRKNAKMAANSNESIAEETLPLTEKTKEKTTETTTERTLVSGQSSQSSAPPASDEEKKPKSKKFKKSKDMTSKSQGDLDSVERGKETTTERTLVCGQSSQSSAPPASDEEKKPKSKKFKKSKVCLMMTSTC
ncbi:butyrophilin-like protein 9 isoform X3 [Brachyhypopomus gauderio]|uniref:butyrophilin-like protein 9 isoform X3 n=1 Tax=Brachyhypopomus gauderio TaxID=698409 RepID=UPI00404154B7